LDSIEEYDPVTEMANLNIDARYAEAISHRQQLAGRQHHSGGGFGTTGFLPDATLSLNHNNQ
jgi:hypothetical protein